MFDLLLAEYNSTNSSSALKIEKLYELTDTVNLFILFIDIKYFCKFKRQLLYVLIKQFLIN